MKKVKMIVPNKSYNGYYGGVAFHSGVGEFTDVEAAIELASRYGYIVEGIDTDVKVSTNVEPEIEDEAEVKPKRKPRKPKAKVGE